MASGSNKSEALRFFVFFPETPSRSGSVRDWVFGFFLLEIGLGVVVSVSERESEGMVMAA